MSSHMICHKDCYILLDIHTLRPHQSHPAVDAGCTAVQSLCRLKEGLQTELALDLRMQREKKTQR